MSGITFEDNDVLESDRGMALYVSDGTALSDVRYLNNRFERNHPDSKADDVPVLGQRPPERLPRSARSAASRSGTAPSGPPLPKAPEIKCPVRGGIEGVVFENLTVGGEKNPRPGTDRTEMRQRRNLLQITAMKRLLAISLFLLTAVPLDAQWLNSDVYDRPLKRGTPAGRSTVWRQTALRGEERPGT